jgi:membrane protein
MKRFAIYRSIFGKTFGSFFKDNVLKLSASLSYYTIFSMGPALLIIISLTGLFFGRDAVQGRIFDQIKTLTGRTAALQIQDVIQNIELSGKSNVGFIIGAVMLVLGATGVFAELQDSINYIWSVKAKPKKGWIKFLMNRLISFSTLIGMGFIFLVSLIIDSALDAVSQRLFAIFPDIIVTVAYIINFVLTFIVTSCIFALIFKLLPDASVRWKDAWRGAFFTSLLFMGGKFLISFYIGNSAITTTYGAATSIIILLVWVYYSSVILFFGAEFTRHYAIIAGRGIHLKKTAVFVVKTESKEMPHATHQG